MGELLSQLIKALVNQSLDLCLFVFGLGFWLPLLTGTTWVEGILVLSISVVAVYLGGVMAFSRTQLKWK